MKQKIIIHKVDLKTENFVFIGKNVWFTVIGQYSAILNQYYKTLPVQYRKFLSDKKLWIFDFSLYDDLVCNLKSDPLRQHVSLEELPAFVVKGLKGVLSNDTDCISSVNELNIEQVTTIHIESK